MDIMFNLKPDQWETGSADYVIGFVEYRISRRQAFAPGVFKYSVGDLNNEDCDIIIATLSGASGKSDPLGGVANCELILDSEFNITAINVDGDCAVRKAK